MKLATLAISTLESFLHNRIVVLVLILGLCILLLMMIPLWGARMSTNAVNQQAMESLVLEEVASVLSRK